MRIAVDAMGGDHAPGPVVAGCLEAATDDGAHLLLVGRRDAIEHELAGLGAPSPDGAGRLSELGEDGRGSIQIVHAEDVVGMDEPATAPLRKKVDSSIRRAAELVRDGEAQAMVSAGNTGAVMIAAKMLIGTVPGVDRPALAAVLPHGHGRTVLLDVGANVETKPAQLREFAVMGHSFAQEVLGTVRPKVGLLSIGEEASKGTGLTREVYQVLQETGLDFVGNVEGGDVFNGTVDVIVCDGFVGNVVLKSAESLVHVFATMLRQETRDSARARLGYHLMRPAFRGLAERTDYAEHGAAPLLGLAGGCFIGHGRSNHRAVRNAVRRASEFVSAATHEKIRDKMTELHNRESQYLPPEQSRPSEEVAR